MITVKHLCKQYKSSNALNGVTFTVNKGEIFAYLGPNGAGKTTTIRILTGLTRPTGGTALIDGIDIIQDPLTAKTRYGLVPQAINLDQELTLDENLQIHGWLYGMSNAAIRAKTTELLTYADLADRRKSLVKTLSGGMKRRLMIVRALLHDPSILFMDEPTVGLDASIRRRIWALIKKIKHAGTTVFLTTHYIEEAEFLADQVAFLDQGRIITIASPQDLIREQGEWAIDRLIDDEMETLYFASHNAAKEFNLNQEEPYTLRRVNLEDAFISHTGRKVT